MFNLFFKMFEKVIYPDLVAGEKYKIKDWSMSDTYYTGIFTKHFVCNEFHHVVFNGRCGKRNVLDRSFHYAHYYRFIPQKERIQQAMESRALTMILKRLINDDFTP
jgi:hypothetical protein